MKILHKKMAGTRLGWGRRCHSAPRAAWSRERGAGQPYPSLVRRLFLLLTGLLLSAALWLTARTGEGQVAQAALSEPAGGRSPGSSVADQVAPAMSSAPARGSTVAAASLPGGSVEAGTVALPYAAGLAGAAAVSSSSAAAGPVAVATISMPASVAVSHPQQLDPVIVRTLGGLPPPVTGGGVHLPEPDSPPAPGAANASRSVTPQLSPPPAGDEDSRAGPAPDPAGRLRHHELTVRPGDSLARLVGSLGVDHRTVHEIVSLNADTAALRRIMPGQKLRLAFDAQGQLQRLRCMTDESSDLVIRRENGRFVATRERISLDAAPRRVAGVIEHSLYRAGKRAGLSERLVMELAGIFAWDIDFILDIRKGDRFSVLYAPQYRQGGGSGRETILAAEFSNRGRVLQALRYVDAAGRADYFTPAGKAMRKAFIRAPVAFTRISSLFDLRRRHPILNRIRAHRGVDYAAPTGTPVQATGDGIIEFIGRKGQYGRTILIRHADRYQTLYAHLSRYARGLTRGSRVRQGQRIGYVGQSGLATGPHLHYEFRVQGVHRDPLRVSLPRAAGIDSQTLADFRARTAPLLAALAGDEQQPPARGTRALQQSVALPVPANDG